MDENIQRVLQIFQKHEMMKRVEMCCSDEHPCETVILFSEIKRLNSEVAALNAAVQGLLTISRTD